MTTAVQQFSTSFSATENPISESGSWTSGSVAGWNDMQTTPGKVFGTQHIPSGYADNCAFITGLSWLSSDYYVEGVVFRAVGYNPAEVHELELLFRGTVTPGAPGTISCYEILMNSAGGNDLVRWNGTQGSFDTGQGTVSIGDVADNDVIRVEVTGNSAVFKKNGVSAGSASNLTLATGVPGVGSFDRGGGGEVLANFGWRSITVGKL